MERQTFIQGLEGRVRARRVLNHPFYESWSAGTLTLDALQGYAQQYYQWVDAFPRFISGVHSNCPDPEVRRRLLENLAEEERPDAPHAELWLDFADALGLTRDEVVAAPAFPETEEAIGTLTEITRTGSFQEGTAALWAYESQVPEIAQRKIEGLRRFYGVTDARSLRYFAVHAEVDVIHARVERDILERNARTPVEKDRVASAVDRSLEASWTLLDGVHATYGASS